MKQLSAAVISTLLAGTSFAVAPAWTQTMSDRVQDGARLEPPPIPELPIRIE